MKEQRMFSDLSDVELKDRYKTYYDAIYNFDCFGVKDIAQVELMERELERRGYEVIETKKPIIKKKGKGVRNG